MAENGIVMAGNVGIDQSIAKADVIIATPKARKPFAKRPDYRKIHALPLPLVVHPLPPLIPHNPLCLLHIAYVYLQQIIWNPSSVPNPRYIAWFSPETQSVQVTDSASILGLWSHGFFGKGSLSRSEPTWLEREKRRRGLLAVDTSEEYTRKRREERRAMKLERARKEREAIEETLKMESGLTKGQVSEVANDIGKNASGALAIDSMNVPGTVPTTDESLIKSFTELSIIDEDDLLLDEPVQDEEHLQLTLEEALFLAAVLGVLVVKDKQTSQAVPLQDLLPLFVAHSTSPPAVVPPNALLTPDDPFLVSYVAYHHFRSLGWVVKPGNKFSVDFLLYLRGPVFAHAEFAVIVLPSYEHGYWDGKVNDLEKPWHWFHMVNRVQSSVRKTLVFCYVEIPPPQDRMIDGNSLVDVLQQYKVREFVYRRWSPNRNRG